MLKRLCKKYKIQRDMLKIYTLNIIYVQAVVSGDIGEICEGGVRSLGP